MNSGTSADGVDLALINFEKRGQWPNISFVDGTIFPYPRRIKVELERVLRDGINNIESFGRLDMAYGAFLGRIASRFISENGLRADLIASHGQTIGHFPAKQKILNHRGGTTIQIGDGNAIAAESGLPAVTDFRRADIAHGGEGAPLTPFVNNLLFSHSKKSRIIVNIGGIANFSYHPAGRHLSKVLGSDCGPGNVLSDLACRLIFHRKYDRDGRLASKGRVINRIVRAIAKANRMRGISTGREQFDHYLLAKLIHTQRKLRANKYDLMASINEATARLIYRSITRFKKDPNLEGVYITGGGRRNLHIVRRLHKTCDPIRVWPVEALGYDGDLLEAVSFAVLGGCFVFGIASTMPRITGGDSGGVAGKLAWPRVD
jgi:anhydro-N-acetylmuramic acid kinase